MANIQIKWLLSDAHAAIKRIQINYFMHTCVYFGTYVYMYLRNRKLERFGYNEILK